MKRFYLRLGIALATFVLGSAAAVYLRRGETLSPEPAAPLPATARPSPPAPPPTPAPSCPRVARSEEKLGAAEAVRVAECFIIKNGYTDLPPAGDESELTSEAVWPGTDEAVMRMRHASLERKAFGYVARPGGWLVVFRYKYKAERAEFMRDYEERLKRLGRTVSMDAYGGGPEVEHQDFILDFPRLTKLSTEFHAGT